MAIPVTIQTQTGFYVTCTGGTGVPVALQNSAGTILVSPNSSIRIVGIASGGANTADVCTVQDGEGNFIFTGASSVLNAVNSLQLGGSIRVTGLQVGFAGATTGYCMIYINAGNS